MELNRSKIFRLRNGNVSSKTPTVEDLIEFLCQYPKDMPVMAGWEGQVKRLGDTETLHHYHEGDPSTACDVLLIDVEY